MLNAGRKSKAPKPLALLTKFHEKGGWLQKWTKSYVSPPFFFSFFWWRSQRRHPKIQTQKNSLLAPGRGEEVKSLEWLNELVRVLWPKMDAAVQKIIHEQVRMEDGGCGGFYRGDMFFFCVAWGGGGFGKVRVEGYHDIYGRFW